MLCALRAWLFALLCAPCAVLSALKELSARCVRLSLVGSFISQSMVAPVGRPRRQLWLSSALGHPRGSSSAHSAERTPGSWVMVGISQPPLATQTAAAARVARVCALKVECPAPLPSLRAAPPARLLSPIYIYNEQCIHTYIYRERVRERECERENARECERERV